MSSKILLHCTFIPVSMIFFFLSACVTIPEATLEEKKLRGTVFDSYNDVIAMIQSGKLVPYQLNVTSGKDKRVREYFGEGEERQFIMFWDRITFSEQELGIENEGYLREENPEIIFPVFDDPVESDSFLTYINAWQFNGIANKKIDVILRSFSTFPTGMFFPYFILVDSSGNPLVRQDDITAIGKEMNKSESIMIWTEDYDLPYTGIYYVFVICDVTNIGKETHILRLSDQRIPVITLYEPIGVTEQALVYKPGSKVGKYELIVRIFE